MTSKSVLTRIPDGKSFNVKELSHWSKIVADDGEEDFVKWYGDNLYVSATKGCSYKVIS